MYADTLSELSYSAQKKQSLLKTNPFGYVISSMLAGLFIGLGIALIFAVGAPFYDAESPAVKLVMGASFGIALSLVIFAGSELFTSNTMTMPVAVLSRKIKPGQAALVIGVSWLGNLIGAFLLAAMVSASGVLEHARHLLEKYALVKMGTGPFELFVRGVLCNILVCLAVWTSTRAKSDSAKLILIFWCLFGFIGTGYEHSVANMSLLAMTIMLGASHAIGWDGYVYNLLVVSAGNLVAGVLFMALPYFTISREKKGAGEPAGNDAAPETAETTHSGGSAKIAAIPAAANGSGTITGHSAPAASKPAADTAVLTKRE